MQYVELTLPLVIRDLLWLILPALNFELTWCATFNLIYAFVGLGIRLLPPSPPDQSSFSKSARAFQHKTDSGNAWVHHRVSGWAVLSVTFFDCLLTIDNRLLPISCHR